MVGADLDALVARIRQAFPDLVFERAVLNQEGVDHAVVVLDGRWIFRFPKMADYIASFPVELTLLRALAPRAALAVPDYRHIAPDRRFGGYPLIEGVELTAPVFARLPRPDQEAIVTELAIFLRALHGMDPGLMRGADRAIRTDEGWPRIDANSYVERRRPTLAAALDPGLIARLDAAHARYPHLAWERNAVIHGDFREAHLLLAPSLDRMAGVIDFGDAVHGDAAYDFSFFWGLADWAADHALEAYGPVTDRDAFLERARYSFVRYAASRLVLALKGRPAYDTDMLLGQLGAQLDRLGL